MSSAIPAITAALVTIIDDAVPTATVFNGPWPTVPDGDYVTVGSTPEGDGPEGITDFPGVNQRVRDETIDIPCYLDSYSGDTDNAERVQAAFTILAAIDTAIQADLTLGGAVPQPGWVSVGNYSVRQEQTDSGDAVGIVFHIVGRARI